MSCDKEIIYQCGHSFSRESLLPNKLSIINPICKTCGIGKLKGYMDKEPLRESTPLLKPNSANDWITTPRYYQEDETLDDEFMDYEFDEEKHKNTFSCNVSLLGLSLIGVIIGIIRAFRFSGKNN